MSKIAFSSKRYLQLLLPLQLAGYSVVADKLNYYRYLSHFRCVHRGAFFAEMRTTSVRKLLPEAWGEKIFLLSQESFHKCLINLFSVFLVLLCTGNDGLVLVFMVQNHFVFWELYFFVF